MDRLIRLIATSIIRGTIYRFLWKRSNGVLIAAASIALLAYVWTQS